MGQENLDNLSEREMLILLCERSGQLMSKVEGHDRRIRGLEKFRWISAGGIGAIGALFKWSH